MNALVDRFGGAPRALLVVPMVGTFFVNVTKGLSITGAFVFDGLPSGAASL